MRPGRRYFGVDGERMGMKRVKEFIKRETVLTAAFLLAALSMVFVSPDRAYGGYVDYQTIALLFCLMAVMAGFQKLGIFSYIGRELLGRVRTGRQAAAVLVGLGMRKLSMGRAFVAQTKKMITGMTISRAREIACKVCDMETAAEIQEYLTSELRDIL